MAHTQLDTSAKNTCTEKEQEEGNTLSFTLALQLLRKCNLYDAYWQAFMAGNIDNEAVVLLNKDDISKIMTKIGDRVKFINTIKSYQQNQHQRQQQCPECDGKKYSTKCDTKKVTCDVCGGKGVQTKIIKYKNKLTCGSCHGKGSIFTRYSRHDFTRDPCHNCNRQGYLYEDAQTSTEYDCAKCSAKGTLAEKEYSTQECNLCHGQGFLLPD
eukprot:UN13043